MKWVIAILIFSLLILFHEFGHFLVARLNGVEVEEFSLGFGPRLISAKRGKTRYSLKLFLFGGSCRMKGMMSFEDDECEYKPGDGSFLTAPAGRRAAIIFAGPLFNFILAFICAVIVLSVVGYDPAEVTYVAPDSAAASAGLMAGDRITNFMGKKVDIGRDVGNWFVFHDLTRDTVVDLTYSRDGEEQTVEFSPDYITRYMLGITYNLDDATAVIGAVAEGSPLIQAGVLAGDVVTAIDGNPITTSKSMNEYFAAHPLEDRSVVLTLERNGEAYTAEVTPAANGQISLGFSYNLGREKLPAAKVLLYGVIELRYWIETTVRSVASLFTGRFSVNDLSGPVGVVDIVGTTYEASKSEGPVMTLMNMLNLIILLSANLGVMNLLPIPALDGGRLVFLLYEAIRGKPVDKNVEAGIQTVAAVLLMILMIYVMYHDVARIVLP